MNTDLCIYRARIGMHHYRLQKLKGVKYLNNFELSVFLAMILYRAGDVEKNPGPVNDNTSDASSSASFPVFNGNFSVVHNNVQSVQHKLDMRLYPPPPTAYRVPLYFARRTAYRVKFYWRTKYYFSGF